MGIESDHCRHSSDRMGAFHNSAHDQLVTKVKTIKDPKGQHRGTLDRRVICSMK
jgi:hypothetical protein